LSAFLEVKEPEREPRVQESEAARSKDKSEKRKHEKEGERTYSNIDDDKLSMCVEGLTDHDTVTRLKDVEMQGSGGQQSMVGQENTITRS
jgi:hypothetical protein